MAKIKKSITGTQIGSLLNKIDKQADIVRFAIHDNQTAYDDDLADTFDNLHDEIVILCELLKKFIDECE